MRLAGSLSLDAGVPGVETLRFAVLSSVSRKGVCWDPLLQDGNQSYCRRERWQSFTYVSRFGLKVGAFALSFASFDCGAFPFSEAVLSPTLGVLPGAGVGAGTYAVSIHHYIICNIAGLTLRNTWSSCQNLSPLVMGPKTDSNDFLRSPLSSSLLKCSIVCFNSVPKL